MRPASMASALNQPPSSACRPNSPKDTLLPRLALPLTFPRWLFPRVPRLGMSGIAILLVQIIAVVDPHLDADVPLRRLGLGKSVLDAGAKRGQRDAAVHAALGAGHLRASQPSRHLDAHSLGA